MVHVPIRMNPHALASGFLRSNYDVTIRRLVLSVVEESDWLSYPENWRLE
jgi:hypothetical protein